MSSQPCGCDPEAGWECIRYPACQEPMTQDFTRERPMPIAPFVQEHDEPQPASKPGEDHMAEANGLVNGDRQAAYGSPRPAYEAMAQVWSGLLAHKLKEPLTAEEVVILMTGLKLVRECRKHKRDNIVDTHGYMLVLAHVMADVENLSGT